MNYDEISKTLSNAILRKKFSNSSKFPKNLVTTSPLVRQSPVFWTFDPKMWMTLNRENLKSVRQIRTVHTFASLVRNQKYVLMN